MAWVATENFEDYADGNNLDGKNGGSGWTSAWTESSAGRWKISNTSAQDGSLSVRHDSFGVNGIEPSVERTFSATSSGEQFSFYIKKTNSHTADGTFVYIRNGATTALYVGFEAGTGNIVYGHAGGQNTLLSSATLDTWYKIKIETNASNYRIAINSLPFSTYRTYSGSITTGVDTFRLGISANNNADYYFYVDNIGPENLGSSDPSVANIAWLTA